MRGAIATVLLFTLYNAWETHRERAAIVVLEKQMTSGIQFQEQQQRELALAHRRALILVNPRSIRIVMTAGRKDLPQLQAAWHAALGIVISGQSLPLPSANRTLQLWLIPRLPSAKPMPSLAFRPETDGKFDLVEPNPPASQSDTKALAVTEEPEGGSPQPTTAPIWIGSLTRK